MASSDPDYSYTQLTLAQRQYSEEDTELPDSQTCLQQLFVSQHEPIVVTPENHDELFRSICEGRSPPSSTNWPLVDRMHAGAVSSRNQKRFPFSYSF